MFLNIRREKAKKTGDRENSNGTFKWREKTSTHKQKRKMRESLVKIKTTLASLGNVNVFQAVCLPNKPEKFVEDPVRDKEEIAEWMAENTVDFYNEVYVLFSFVTEDNKEWQELLDDPAKVKQASPDPALFNNGYPPRVKYLWRASSTAKPTELPVDVYVEHIFLWVDALIDNEDIFPTEEDVPFPDDFRTHILKMYQRMFRVYAIIFSNDCLLKNSKVQHAQLKTSLKHFLYFCWKWDLLNEKETKCIDKIVAPIKKAYNHDLEEFRKTLN